MCFFSLSLSGSDNDLYVAHSRLNQSTLFPHEFNIQIQNSSPKLSIWDYTTISMNIYVRHPPHILIKHFVHELCCNGYFCSGLSIRSSVRPSLPFRSFFWTFLQVDARVKWSPLKTISEKRTAENIKQGKIIKVNMTNFGPESVSHRTDIHLN